MVGSCNSKCVERAHDPPGRGDTLDRVTVGGRVEQAGWTENRPSTGWFQGLKLGELFRYRELLLFLALKELKVRYKQTLFGIGWVVLQPLVAMGVFSVVFGRFAGLPSDGLPYAVFVLAGLSIWLYFSNAVRTASETLVEDPSLVTKVYLPRMLAPAAAVLPGLIDLAVSLVVVGLVMAIVGVAPGPALLLLPVWIAAAVLVALGAGLWLSALNVLYRDVRSVVPFLLQVWLFASPVVFPSSLIEPPEEYFYALNPLVGVLDGFRWSLLDAPPPGPEDLISLASGALLLISGLAYFRHAERRFADQI
jgi:lipopolysaccharide transport system permease protein